MDTLAKKTMRGMSSTFGTLADTLHLPDSMRCCGVGAIEAQIAAAEDIDDGSTSDESVFAYDKDKKKKRSGTKVSKLAAEGESGRGLRGMLSSARSLGWGKRKGVRGGKGTEDNQSKSSQVSALSFLSGGLKKLPFSSGGKTLFKSFRAPLPLLDKGSSGVSASSGFISLSDTERSDDDEPTRGALLWRHVRMVVRGVRGMPSTSVGCCRLDKTVVYQAARQGIVRVKLARRKMGARRSAARAACKRGEELRFQRRRREIDAKRRYKEACRGEGRRILEWAVKVFLQPRAIIDLQRVWRGYRARKRLAAYLKWLEDRARRRREYQRYLDALAAKRGATDRGSEQARLWRTSLFLVKRRVWGRVEFAHTGWRPRYEVENPPDMHDHVWSPPRGSSSGVRTLKVLLPPASERDRRTLTEDKNAWAGVPVGITKRRPPPERLGPPPRPGTITAADERHRPLPPSGRSGERAEVEGRVLTKYNWLPAPLVGKTELLQIPK
ncbi:unnamed protein product, partial [Hapterophycus canaliculatus]